MRAPQGAATSGQAARCRARLEPRSAEGSPPGAAGKPRGRVRAAPPVQAAPRSSAARSFRLGGIGVKAPPTTADAPALRPPVTRPASSPPTPRSRWERAAPGAVAGGAQPGVSSCGDGGGGLAARPGGLAGLFGLPALGGERSRSRPRRQRRLGSGGEVVSLLRAPPGPRCRLRREPRSAAAPHGAERAAGRRVSAGPGRGGAERPRCGRMGRPGPARGERRGARCPSVLRRWACGYGPNVAPRFRRVPGWRGFWPNARLELRVKSMGSRRGTASPSFAAVLVAFSPQQWSASGLCCLPFNFVLEIVIPYGKFHSQITSLETLRCFFYFVLARLDVLFQEKGQKKPLSRCLAIWYEQRGHH